MLFSFLKYLQPTHYFHHYMENGASVFPKINELPTTIKISLEEDPDFLSDTARRYDLSWQALKKGYLGDAETYTQFEPLPLEDNYRFVRKYFHSSWSLYILLLRLFFLHHPIKELRAWYKTRGVSRSLYYKAPILYPYWFSFKSTLIQRKTKVSVIIPTLNRYSVLSDVLHDLEKQDYTNFEVVVVDQSDDFNREFYDAFHLDFQIIRQTEKALWLARNTAIKAAKGELIALSEDDVRVGPNWLREHLKCLDFFDAQVSAGVFYPEGKQMPQERSYFVLASQFATGNAMLYKDVFKLVGLFDRQFERQRMGDGEFGMRLYLKGIKSISNPYAHCLDVKASTGGLREMGSWDAFRPSRFFAPRPIPSVTYYFRRYFGNKAARLALLRIVPISLFSYKLKKNKIALLFSLFLAILLLPVIFYQVYKSWSLASNKLKVGPMIEFLSSET